MYPAVLDVVARSQPDSPTIPRLELGLLRPRSTRDFSAVHWERIVGSIRAEPMRRAVLRALQQSYDENCRRHSPEDLGDNNVTFGVSVSQNLRFLLERELQDFPGVEIVRPRGSFAVRVDQRFELFFYKAPPGVFDIRALKLDATRTQVELVDRNTNQLSLFELPADDGPAELLSVVCIHFGDPLEGLRRADIGAPHALSRSGLQWQWAECLDSGEILLNESETAGLQSVEEDDEDFGLRLRADESDEGMTDGSSA